jgi:hypothetical protein
MTELVRKGALAEDRIRHDLEVAVACDDLARLADFGALAGVAEVIRERLRQVGAKRHDPASDDQLVHGELATEAVIQLNQLRVSRRRGLADIGSDEAHLRQAAALCAAEIDRLNRMLGAQETAGILADPETMDAIREGESDQR